jgi:hypothetical protein
MSRTFATLALARGASRGRRSPFPGPRWPAMARINEAWQGDEYTQHARETEQAPRARQRKRVNARPRAKRSVLRLYYRVVYSEAERNTARAPRPSLAKQRGVAGDPVSSSVDRPCETQPSRNGGSERCYVVSCVVASPHEWRSRAMRAHWWCMATPLAGALEARGIGVPGTFAS